MKAKIGLQYFNNDSDIDAIIEAIKLDGACVVHDMLSATACDQLVQDFLPHLNDLSWGQDDLGYRSDFYGRETKRLHGLFSKSARMEQVLLHPLLNTVSQAMLCSEGAARDIRLSNCELMVLNQGQANQVLHSDAASWVKIQAAEKPQEILISANIALTRFTTDNGATRVVPGSHHWASEREPLAAETCLAVMPKGAALLYSGNVLHSGGENITPAERIGLYLGFSASYLRPLENQLITNDPADVLALSSEAKQLLDIVDGGFTVYA